MRNRGVDLRQTLARFALLGLIGGLAGACSESTRLAGNPFANPFGTSSEPPMTGSLADQAAPTAPTAKQPASSVQSQPLAAPAYNRPAPVASAPAAPAAAKAPAQHAASGPAGWTTHGGTPVTLRQGETLNAIATRYNVPANEILHANGLKSAAQVVPGRQIVIPVYNAAGGVAAPASHPAA